MKKIILIIIPLLGLLLTLNYFPETSSTNIKEKKDNTHNDIPLEEKGVFISYIDYANLKGKNKNEMESIITQMINNIDYFGLSSIILQVVPFSDSIYPSKIYKSSHTAVRKEGDDLPLDILKYFITRAKEKNIDVYAWINPYRIRNENNTGDINKESFYYKWLKTNKIERSDKGIFLNPADEEVLKYITSGIKEICENYEIKGILFDDYYYPTETIDLKNYEKTDKKKTLKQYRIDNINKLIEESYNTVKSVNKSIKFGLSPAGNIENNLDKEYLDVKQLLKGNKIDFIMPQLYYGFNNEGKPYISTLDSWNKLNINNKDFYIALSLYKSGKIDEWAGKGENEWMENSNIIKKQILISRNKENYKGFYIFRYEYLFYTYDNDNLEKEIYNLKKLLEKE